MFPLFFRGKTVHPCHGGKGIQLHGADGNAGKSLGTACAKVPVIGLFQFLSPVLALVGKKIHFVGKQGSEKILPLGIVGADLKAQAAFEARRYASVAANAHGTVASMYGVIGQIDGVLDLQVLENAGPEPATLYGVQVGGHSVAVCVYGGEDADIAQAIYQKKDAGCGTSGNHSVTYTAENGAVYTYQIVRPETETFSVQVAIPGASSLSQSVQQAIQQAVVTDFLGQGQNARVGLASTVYASRFYPAVLAVEGVIQLTSIEIALGSGGFSDAVTINADIEPTMTTDNVTIVEG